MKPVICPVCNGSGQYKAVFPADTCVARFRQCHGCDGKGWVEVHGDMPAHYEEFLSSYPDPLQVELGWRWQPEMYQGTVTYPDDYNDRCPACGGLRSDPPGTGCPKGSHYGAYCVV